MVGSQCELQKLGMHLINLFFFFHLINLCFLQSTNQNGWCCHHTVIILVIIAVKIKLTFMQHICYQCFRFFAYYL